MAQIDPRIDTPIKRKLKVEDLFTITRDEPLIPTLSAPLSTVQEEIKTMYLHEYGRGIDQLLETTWYTDKGVDYLLRDHNICQTFGGMLELFSNTQVNDYEKFLKLPQIEARVIWMLLCMPRNAVSGAEVQTAPSQDPLQLVDVLRRLSVFEALIVNDNLADNPLNAAYYSRLGGNPNITRVREFWSELGRFVTLPASDPVAVECCLDSLRLLLDQRENRDVLYSMAIVRHFGRSASQLPIIPNSNGKVPAPDGEARLIVAKKFIEDEASSKGTTQVIQRLCGMAVRSWVAMR